MALGDAVGSSVGVALGGGVAGDCKKAGMKGKPACSAPGQVLRFPSVATYSGNAIDLIVSNRSHYEPTTSCDGCNGATKGFGKINVRIGTGVRLRFDFVDPDDGDAPADEAAAPAESVEFAP